MNFELSGDRIGEMFLQGVLWVWYGIKWFYLTYWGFLGSLMQIESFNGLAEFGVGIILFLLVISFFFWKFSDNHKYYIVKLLANIFLLVFLYIWIFGWIFKFIKVSSKETMKAINRGSRKAAASPFKNDFAADLDWEQKLKPSIKRVSKNALIIGVIIAVLAVVGVIASIIF